MIHTVLVSYKRRSLTEQTLDAYMQTRPPGGTIVIVDNGSPADVTEWLCVLDVPVVLLRENRYPGAAANIGFGLAPPTARYLHRLDNDTKLLPGWWEDAVELFESDPKLGQYGLVSADDLASETVTWETWPVGGNSIIRRELWDAGLRYSERPWGPAHALEDHQLTLDIWERGYQRCYSSRPTMEYLIDDDEKYRVETHRVRGSL